VSILALESVRNEAFAGLTAARKSGKKAAIAAAEEALKVASRALTALKNEGEPSQEQLAEENRKAAAEFLAAQAARVDAAKLAARLNRAALRFELAHDWPRGGEGWGDPANKWNPLEDQGAHNLLVAHGWVTGTLRSWSLQEGA